MAQRVRMTLVDTAWLRMDSPANLMMIVGVDVFDGRLDIERLRAVLLSHLCSYREFRSRVVIDPTERAMHAGSLVPQSAEQRKLTS